MRFKIIKNRAGQFRCQIVAANGEIVWWTENYKDKQDAQKAIESLFDAIKVMHDWTFEQVNEPEADDGRETEEVEEVSE